MADILFDHVRKAFGGAEVIRGVSMDIHSGEFIVFVGPSGCGKSTLLRLVAGLEEITGGILKIGGKIVNDVSPAERGLAMVFQSYALYPHMTAYENMAFGLRQSGVNAAAVDAAVREAARILHIEELLTRKPKQLSGGQRQRVAIGRAIVRKPSVFLFDEPLSNLDASLRVQMRMEIAKLHKQLAATMIYVTHDQAEAMTLADRIVVLQSGLVEQIGSPQELYHHPANVFVAGFIGSPKMNFLPGTLVEWTEDGAVVSLGGGAPVRARIERDAAVAAGDAVTLGIRPEQVRLSNDGSGLPGRIDYVEQLGDSQFAFVRIAGDAIVTARIDGAIEVRSGGAVKVTLPEPECHLFKSADGKALKRKCGDSSLPPCVLGSV